MTELIAFVVFVITLPFVLLFGVIAAPFGKADDVAKGYELWICEISLSRDECVELQKNDWEPKPEKGLEQ